MSGEVVRYYMRENPINGDVYMAESTPGCDADLYVLDTDYAALQAKLDAVTKDAEALRSALNPQQWNAEMSTAWHLNIPDLQKAFEELTKAALTDQGRAGEGRGDG